MSAVTGIEWTDRTWNPVRGCSIVSPGCVNCYAMKFAHRFSGKGGRYEGLTKQTSAGPQWTGKVIGVESALLEPLKWKRPQRVFVNSMSDLFHEAVPDEFIGQVLNAILWAGKARGHQFQVLTKRPERMRDCMRRYYAPGGLDGTGNPSLRQAGLGDVIPWLWLGVSCEDQQRADERIPFLLETPAAVRFVSAEPLLGPIRLDELTIVTADGNRPRVAIDAMRGHVIGPDDVRPDLRLDWVIVGGESGSAARTCEVDWIRSLVRQCTEASVPVFVKQLGGSPLDRAVPVHNFVDALAAVGAFLKDRKGGDPLEWPSDLRVRQFPEARS